MRGGYSSEYTCIDKDADYLRPDVDNSTLGIFRISASVAALIELLPSLALASNIYEADGDAEKSDRASQSRFDLAYNGSNIGEHECAIDHHATKDQDEQNKHHFAGPAHFLPCSSLEL